MSKKVLVVGGGVIGLCTAYYAARRGHAVTVLDRESAEHQGCSFGNAGMVVPSHFVPLAAPGMVALGLKWMWNPESPFWIKPRLDFDLMDWGWKFWRAANPDHVRRSAPILRDLHLASRACFQELASLPGNDFGLVEKGLLMLCKTQHGFEEECKAAEQARALDIPAEVLDPGQAAALDPGIRMEIAGAIYFPKDCHLTPHRFMSGLQHQLQKMGVHLSWSTEVIGWHVKEASFTSSPSASGHRQKTIKAVRTSRGDFDADEFVLCGGSWSPSIARELQLDLPMQAGKGYSLTLPNPRQLPSICAILTEARLAVTPMGKDLRFAGTMEIAGLNETINPRRIQGILKSIPQYYPDFSARDFASIQPWCGLRPCSPDGLPYAGRVRSFSNFSVATGHAMMGLSLGPITGKLMSEILSDESPSMPMQILDPDRYAH
ncbi:MAG: FAD-dependent oxidoreductase [Verrucomicrobiota bacterium]